MKVTWETLLNYFNSVANPEQIKFSMYLVRGSSVKNELDLVNWIKTSIDLSAVEYPHKEEIDRYFSKRSGEYFTELTEKVLNKDNKENKNRFRVMLQADVDYGLTAFLDVVDENYVEEFIEIDIEEEWPDSLSNIL